MLYISGGNYSLKSTPNFFFWETFHGSFIYSQSFGQKHAERKSPKEYLVPHTTYIMCENFIHTTVGPSLKSTPSDKLFFEKLFMVIFIYS